MSTINPSLELLKSHIDDVYFDAYADDNHDDDENEVMNEKYDRPSELLVFKERFTDSATFGLRR